MVKKCVIVRRNIWRYFAGNA